MARRASKGTDPRLQSSSWRGIVAYWQAQQSPYCRANICLLPGIPIRYTGIRGPDSLDVGHIVARDNDHRTQWTVPDTRPEHSRCNRSAGASAGNRKRGRTRARTKLVTTRAW
jgi:5-methylcytosine-specific restriction endonuclease McrA